MVSQRNGTNQERYKSCHDQFGISLVCFKSTHKASAVCLTLQGWAQYIGNLWSCVSPREIQKSTEFCYSCSETDSQVLTAESFWQAQLKLPKLKRKKLWWDQVHLYKWEDKKTSDQNQPTGKKVRGTWMVNEYAYILLCIWFLRCSFGAIKVYAPVLEWRGKKNRLLS